MSEIGGREKVDRVFILLKGMEIRLGPVIWEISRTQGKTKILMSERLLNYPKQDHRRQVAHSKYTSIGAHSRLYL